MGTWSLPVRWPDPDAGLDRWCSLPTGESLAKQGRHVTAAEDRYQDDDRHRHGVCPRFSVSRVDIDRGGPTTRTPAGSGGRSPTPNCSSSSRPTPRLDPVGWQELGGPVLMARFVGVSRPGFELDSKHRRHGRAAARALTLVEIGPGDLVHRLPPPLMSQPIWVPGSPTGRALRLQTGLYRQEERRN